jgi:hypothetical protein
MKTNLLLLCVFFVQTLLSQSVNCNCYTYKAELFDDIYQNRIMVVNYEFYQDNTDSIIIIAYVNSFNNNIVNNKLDDTDTSLVIFYDSNYISWSDGITSAGSFMKYSFDKKGDVIFFNHKGEEYVVKLDTEMDGPNVPFFDSSFRILSVSNRKIKFTWDGCSEDCRIPYSFVKKKINSFSDSSIKNVFLEFF